MRAYAFLRSAVVGRLDLAPFKMAAFPEREYRKLLTDSLLSEEVSNSYTLDEFKDFFPRKYR